MQDEIKNELKGYIYAEAKQAMDFLKEKEFFNIPDFKIDQYANELADEQMKHLPLDMLSSLMINTGMKLKPEN